MFGRGGSEPQVTATSSTKSKSTTGTSNASETTTANRPFNDDESQTLRDTLRSEAEALKVSIAVAIIGDEASGKYRSGDDCENLGYYLQRVSGYKDRKGTLSLLFDVNVEEWRKTHGERYPISRLPQALRVTLFDENEEKLTEFVTQERFCFAPTRDEFNAGSLAIHERCKVGNGNFPGGIRWPQIEEHLPDELGKMMTWYGPDEWQQFANKAHPAEKPWPGVLLLKANANFLTYTVNIRDLDYSSRVRISSFHPALDRQKDLRWVYSEFDDEAQAPSKPNRDDPRRILPYITGGSHKWIPYGLPGGGNPRQVTFEDVKRCFDYWTERLCDDYPGLNDGIHVGRFIVRMRGILLALTESGDCSDSELTEEEAIGTITSLKRLAELRESIPSGARVFDVPIKDELAIQRELAGSAFKRFSSEYAAAQDMSDKITSSADFSFRLETIFMGNWKEYVFGVEPPDVLTADEIERRLKMPITVDIDRSTKAIASEQEEDAWTAFKLAMERGHPEDFARERLSRELARIHDLKIESQERDVIVPQNADGTQAQPPASRLTPSLYPDPKEIANVQREAAWKTYKLQRGEGVPADVATEELTRKLARIGELEKQAIQARQSRK